MFPAHSLKIVLGLLLVAVVLRVGLHFWVLGLNDNIRVQDNPEALYADVVEVEPGSSYFFTWGVTASPRMRHISRTRHDAAKGEGIFTKLSYQLFPGAGLDSDENGEAMAGERSDADRYGDTYEQAYGVLRQLGRDLNEVGLTLKDVVNVRAYLVMDAEGDDPQLPSPEEAFAQWNDAYDDFFGTASRPHKPARTTVGITRLFHSAYRIEVEFICAFPENRGPLSPGTRHYERYQRLQRTETSPHWASFGRPAWPMRTGKAVEGGTPLFFSSMVRPQPLVPNMPPQFQMFGTTTQQAQSIFSQMEAQLQDAGLGFEDIFFVRTLVFPDPRQSIGRSFADFGKVYQRYLNNERTPNRPTRTIMSTPGFAHKKQFIAVEYFAAYPQDDAPETGEATLASFGETPAITSSEIIAPGGTAIPAQARALWVSATVPGVEGDLNAQAASALSALEERLARSGARLDDLVHLRAYITTTAGPQLDQRLATWERFFNNHFGIDERPHKPALTTLPVVAIPGGGLITLEAMAAIADD